MSTPYTVIDEGHAYELANTDGSTQQLTFIKKQPKEEGSTELETVTEGTTTEAVLGAVLDRLKHLYKMLPDEHTKRAIGYIESAVTACDLRAKDRDDRGVRGTLNA